MNFMGNFASAAGAPGACEEMERISTRSGGGRRGLHLHFPQPLQPRVLAADVLDRFLPVASLPGALNKHPLRVLRNHEALLVLVQQFLCLQDEGLVYIGEIGAAERLEKLAPVVVALASKEIGVPEGRWFVRWFLGRGAYGRGEDWEMGG